MDPPLLIVIIVLLTVSVTMFMFDPNSDNRRMRTATTQTTSEINPRRNCQVFHYVRIYGVANPSVGCLSVVCNVRAPYAAG